MSGKDYDAPPVHKILSKLLDKKLISRFGSGVKSSVSSEEALKKKYAILQEEFNKINKDKNEYIDEAELSEFIQSYKPNIQNLKGYAAELFKKIDINHDGRISIEEFVSNYLLLEERLKVRKFQLIKIFDEVYEMIGNLKKEKENHKNEKLNSLGVRDDACVKITIIEAYDLRPMDFSGTSDPYCCLHFNGKNKMKTQIKNNTLNPVWNEDFSL